MRSSIAAVAVALAGLPATAPAAQAQEGWTWPVRGRVLTAYVNDNARPYAGGMHRGIDIASQEGTPVRAARSGTVTYAGALGSSGIVVAVRSDDARHVASYLHLAAEGVSRGEHVTAGARIGAVGTTGRRSVAEAHLHFGVRLADVEDHYVDPLSLLAVRGASEAPAPGAAPAPLPVRPQEQVVRAPAAVRARAASAARVPAGRMPVARGGPIRHPVAATVAQRRAHAPDRGRPLVLAGLGLVAVVLFGGVLVRANEAINRRAAVLYRSVVKAGRSAPRPRSRPSTAGRGSR